MKPYLILFCEVKMKKNIILIIILSIYHFNIYASMFGEENATLSAILTEEIFMAANVSETVTQLKAILDAGNQAINLARESYRQFEAIRNYTVEDLLNDAKAGFCEGLETTTETNCTSWAISINEMSDNIKMISGGQGEQFVAYRSRWDSETYNFLKQMYHGSAKAFVYPKIAPNVSKFYGWDQHEDDAEYVIQQALLKSGLFYDVIRTQQEGYTVSSAMVNFIREAEESKNVIAQGQTVELMQDQLRNKYLNEMNLRDKARFIEEENTKEILREERKTFMDSYREHSKKSNLGEVFENGKK